MLLLLIGTTILFPFTPNTDGNALGIILLEGAGCIDGPEPPTEGPIFPPTLVELFDGMLVLLTLLLDAPPTGPDAARPCPLFAGLFSLAPPLASNASNFR